MKIKISFSTFLLIPCVITAAAFFSAKEAAAASDIRDMVFPVSGFSTYSDSFGASRSGGRTHEGIDIFGYKMQPLVATVNGSLHHVAYPEPYYGYGVFLHGDDGYDYWYLHINNDTPGTDDGLGDGMNAFGIDIATGNPVTQGQLIGYMGDSGNAESTSPHLHFEIHRPDGNIINPYESLLNAPKIAAPIFHPPLPGEILPFTAFEGGAAVARGNVDTRYPGEEIIAGAGPGGGPHVKVYSREGLRLSGFFPYPTGFRGGVDVAAGDVDGDGVDEIITGAGPGGGPHVRIFDREGNLKGQFFAYAVYMKSGVRVAAADMNGDGADEIITGAGPGGGPHVRIFKQDGTRIGQFFAYDEHFRGGIDVAAFPATAQSRAMIVTAAGPGGGPHVRIFTMRGDLQDQFFAFDASFRGGVRISAANIETSSMTPEIVAVPASGGGPQVRMFFYRGTAVRSYMEFEPWWRGGYDIASGYGSITISSTTGGRRTSIRSVAQ
ncbi:MAG: VCBS repeat domain-containing M23 family metallopeptidase [Patescibacteria group bacterium]